MSRKSTDMNLRIAAVAIMIPASLISACTTGSAGERRYFPIPEDLPELTRLESHAFVADTVVSGLTRPYGLEFLPDGRVLITERGGNLLIVRNGEVQEAPVAGNVPAGLHDDGTFPKDNPFVDSRGAFPETYSYGHRQHEGLVRHPETGALWSKEHGENGGDELNIIMPGRNYGWPLATHSVEYDGAIISEDPLLEGTEPPVHFWTSAIGPSGVAVVVGDRYRGRMGNLFTGSLARRMLNRTVMENGR